MKLKSLLLLSFLICSYCSTDAQTIPKNFCKRIKNIKKAIKADKLPHEKDDSKKVAIGRVIGETMYQTTYKFFDSSAVYKMNRFNTKEYKYFAFYKLDTSKTKVIAYCNELQDAVEKCGFKMIGIDKDKRIDAKNTYALYSSKNVSLTVDMPYSLTILENLGYTIYAARLTFEVREF